MAFDAFVKIDGIDGESTDEKHPDWIEVLDFGLGVKQKVSSTASSAGGASAGRAEFREIVIKKLVDKSSPGIALACADGTHIDEIILELCRAGTNKIKFMAYRLKNCIVSQVATTGGGNFPTETVRINFGQIQWVYTQQKRAGGQPAGNIATGWNLQRNCKI
ncbi:MAG: type VI secretion system tube protein Hcp [Desulfatitalea sp.]